jgi:hypothetical protein
VLWRLSSEGQNEQPSRFYALQKPAGELPVKRKKQQVLMLWGHPHAFREETSRQSHPS